MHNWPLVRYSAFRKIILVEATGWGFLEVSVGVLCRCFKGALDPPLNRITTSVSLLNAKGLSQQQVFRAWGSDEAGGAAL